MNDKEKLAEIARYRDRLAKRIKEKPRSIMPVKDAVVVLDEILRDRT